jgi:tetratricopeptide (TPR) repeat protein
MGGPQGYTGVNEWALYGHTAAAYWLGERGTALSYGEEFLARFPTSAYAIGLRGYLDHVLRVARAEKAGRPQIPALRATALAMPLMMGCVVGRDPARRLQACRDWSALQDEAGDLVERNEDTELNWAHAGLHAGDLGDIQRALDHVRARDRYAKGVERIEDLLDDGRDRQSRADLAAAAGRQASSEEDFRAAVVALILGARYADAKALIERGLAAHPGGNRLYESGTDLAIATFDIEYGQAMIARWEKAEDAHGARVKARSARTIRELPDELAELAQMQGVGMQMYAATLAGAGLYKESGDAYIACVRAGWDEAGSLSTAGNMYQAGLHPEEARAAFEEVLARFPEHAAAVAAKSMLELLP